MELNAVETEVVRLVRLLSGASTQDVVVVTVDDPANCVPDAGGLDLRSSMACARLGATKLGAPSADVRQAALELTMRDEHVLFANADAVNALLRDPVWFVRRAAVVATARLLPLSSFVLTALLERLRVDDSSDVRASAVRALQHGVEFVPSEKACDALMEAAASDDAWDVRAAAVRMRAPRRRDRAPSLLAAFDPPSPPSHTRRARCKSAVGLLGAATPSSDATATIAARFSDTAAGVRTAAVEAVGAIGANTVAAHATAILALTNDADPQTRETAERVLRCAGISPRS